MRAKYGLSDQEGGKRGITMPYDMKKKGKMKGNQKKKGYSSSSSGGRYSGSGSEVEEDDFDFSSDDSDFVEKRATMKQISESLDST